MKIKDFKAVPQEDYPQLPKELQDAIPKFMTAVLAPIQNQIRDLTQLAQKRIGFDNLNQEILEGKVMPGTESVFSLTTLNGAPKGGTCILVDSVSNVSLFRLRIIDEKKVGLTVDLDPAVTVEVQARFLIIGA